MWYVVQVRTATEENICMQCRKRIDSHILQRCFTPYYEEKRRVQGEWKIRKKILFPGYIFMVTDRLRELYDQLKQINGLTKLLGTGADIVPLTEEEELFLRRLGGEEQIVRMSEGIIEGTQVKISTGPLAGMEGSIRRIDRHKRKAYLEMQMFGRIQQMQVGLEIIQKN